MGRVDSMEKIEIAKQVLLTNRRSGFTVPRADLYPFQWNWDSAFIAHGYSHFELDYAITEFESLFSGQWENGMIPQILFHSRNEKSYFPNFDVWESNVNAGAPKDLATSGISQPPVHAFLIEQIVELHPDDEKLKAFVKQIFPKLKASHQFLYQYRDPKKEGLAFIYHPWESGRDNSPIWDHVLKNINLTPDQIPTYQRKDTDLMEASERPTTYQYDRFVYLLELGKRFKYDGSEIAETSPLVFQDCLLNAVLIHSNASLIRMGKRFGFDVGEIEEWQAQSVKAFKEKMWNASIGAFVGFDMVEGKQVPMLENGSFVPLIAELADANQAQQLTDHLQQWKEAGYLLCPSFDPNHAAFEPKRYWRGPVWPHMNWMIARGLAKYGQHAMAKQVQKDTTTLIENHGFQEYFDPRPGVTTPRGCGGDQFSWTASTYLDFTL